MLTGYLSLIGSRLNHVNPVKKCGVFRFAMDERPSAFSPACVSLPASLCNQPVHAAFRPLDSASLRLCVKKSSVSRALTRLTRRTLSSKMLISLLMLKYHSHVHFQRRNNHVPTRLTTHSSPLTTHDSHLTPTSVSRFFSLLLIPPPFHTHCVFAPLREIRVPFKVQKQRRSPNVEDTVYRVG